MPVVASVQPPAPVSPAVLSQGATWTRGAHLAPGGWLYGDATLARHEPDAGTSDSVPLRLRLEPGDGWHRSSHRTSPFFVKVICAGGLAVAGAGGPVDLSRLSREPVRTSLIRIIDPPLHGSPSIRAEVDYVLTHSGGVETLASAQEAQARIRHLGTLGADWDGTDVAAPNPDAMVLIAKLATAGASLRPRIGLESDGTVGFSFFREGRAIADMTIPGDSTYSYFAWDDGEPTSRNDARIGSPIPPDLLAILAA